MLDLGLPRVHLETEIRGARILTEREMKALASPLTRRLQRTVCVLVPALAAIVLVLAGCTASPTVTDGAHRLIVATTVPSAMAGVGFGGTLGYDKAGCVVLGTDAVLIAPPGSTLQGGVLTLGSRSGAKRSFTIGETTDQLGGMEVGTSSKFVPPGTRCSSTEYLLLE